MATSPLEGPHQRLQEQLVARGISGVPGGEAKVASYLKSDLEPLQQIPGFRAEER